MITDTSLIMIWWRHHDRPHKTKTSSSNLRTARFPICINLERKPIKALFDFPHNTVSNDPLRAFVTEDPFSVFESYLNNRFHINGKSTQQVVPRLLQRFCLNLRDDGGNFAVCDSFRYLFHFCPVFCGSAAVSVLCSVIFQIAVVAYTITA